MNSISARIKKLKDDMGSDLCIMGHHYQSDSVAEHCDIMGDSLELARQINGIDAKNIVFCGVYFMGETAALLAKERQSVFLPEPDADCMMSLMASAKLARRVLNQLSASGRRVIPLAYVNTMLELKDVVGEWGGAVCTSANSEKMLKWALNKGDSVLFLPDKHLGRNTATKMGLSPANQYVLRINGSGILPGQEDKIAARLLLWPGSCAVHAKLSDNLVSKVRENNEKAIVLAHPECKPEVISKCDASGSTSFLINEVSKIVSSTPGAEIVVGTEENLVSRLAKKYSGLANIRPLGRAFCPHMEKVTPEKLLITLENIVAGRAVPVRLDSEKTENAKNSILRMLEVCSG